jgi:hypothetical protein
MVPRAGNPPFPGTLYLEGGAKRGGRSNMFKKSSHIMVICSIVFLQGCGVFFFKDDELSKYLLHEEQYKPYELQDTIEGYREFIAKYPENLYVKVAESRIEDLEFASYKQADSLEGYMEFKMRYPDNRHVFKASTKIEQAELKRYEEMDTVEGYREFLLKYPVSTFAVLAKERLQELEFRELDRTLRKNYGFDLLRYRLLLRRLKKKLSIEGGLNLGGFTCFASIADYEGKKYFHTHLIYTADPSYSGATSGEVSEKLFDPILSKALVYLDENFVTKGGIDGFSFDVSSSAHRFYGDRHVLLEHYFPINQVNLFTKDEIKKADLLAKSLIVFPKEVAPEATQVASVTIPETGDGLGAADETPSKEGTAPPVEMDGFKIMTMVSERDRGEDYIICRSWKRGGHIMKNIEKRKNFKGNDGFIYKSIERYVDPMDQYGAHIITWNYKNKKNAFWFKSHRGRSVRITDTSLYRSPAELDLCVTDYLDIKVGEEKHELLRNEELDGKPCYLVESVPIREDMRYGKRISWIDQHYFLPLKIEYYDKGGDLWKILQSDWQNKFGFWFWEKAGVENVQTGEKTLINTEDVRVNVGLRDRDFSTEKRQTL